MIPVSLLTWADGPLTWPAPAPPPDCPGTSVITKLAAEASFDALNWQLMTSDNQALVIAAKLEGEDVIVRYALSDAAERASARNATILETIAQNDRLGSWRELVPVVRKYGPGQLPVLVETRLTGRPATGLARAQSRRSRPNSPGGGALAPGKHHR